ncbi:MAG: hypothetical protein K0R88_1664 [Solirubrobacterales bacterium]|nr:hypothetical protein [Solirubrobacterales bacterium]
MVEPLAGPELRSRLAGGAMTTDHIGIEGLRAGWEDFLRAFEGVRVDFEEIVEVGDAVVDGSSSTSTATSAAAGAG